MKSKKTVQTILFAKQRETDVENKYIDTKQKREGGGGRNWDTGIDTNT